MVDKANPTNYMNNMAPAAVNPPDQLPTDETTSQPSPAASPDMSGAPQTGQPQTPSTSVGQGGPEALPAKTNMQGVPSANRPHPVAKAFDGILRNISGGPIYVTDPVTGQRREVPQSKSMMAKSIVAAALAGLMTPDRYVDTPFGPRKDIAGGAEAAIGAGMKSRQDREAQAQKLTDDQQSRKLFTAQNNMQMATQMAALAHQKFDTLDQQVKYNKESFNKPVEAYMQETGINPYEAHGMTDQEVYKSGHRLDDNNVIADDIRMVPDGKGGMEPQPLYSIIKNDFKVTLPEEVTKLLGRFNKPIDTAFQQTGGRVTIPVNAYMGMVHTFHSINDVENSLTKIQQQIDPKFKGKIDISSMYKANPVAMDAAVKQYEQILANGMGSDKHDESSQWFHLVQAVDSVPGGHELLSHVTTPKDVSLTEFAEKERNDWETDRKKAELGGMSKPGAPASAERIQAAKDLIASNVPKEQQSMFLDRLAGIPTNGGVDKAMQDVRDQFNKNLDRSTAGTDSLTPPKGFRLDPNAQTLGSSDLRTHLESQGVKLPSNYEALYAVGHNASDLKSLPTSPRRGTNQMSQTDGLAFIRQYVNPNYQEGDYAAAATLSKELASTKQNTAGGTLYNAGTASQHLDLLAQASTALQNGDLQGLNNIANKLGTAVGQSPANTFMAIADQANGEVAKVVAGGKANEPELEALRQRLNQSQSPQQVDDVIKAYIGLMAGRVNEINERSQQYFGRDVKGISPMTAKVFARYGVEVPGYTKVQIPGLKPQLIPSDRLPQFKQKFPNAVVTK